MRAMWFALIGAALAGSIVTGLVGDEIRGWIGRVPYALLWIASRRVPADRRASLVEDWRADLAFSLHDKAERPITRLLFGIWFAADLIRGAARVAAVAPTRNLGPHHDVSPENIIIPKLPSDLSVVDLGPTIPPWAVQEVIEEVAARRTVTIDQSRSQRPWQPILTRKNYP